MKVGEKFYFRGFKCGYYRGVGLFQKPMAEAIIDLIAIEGGGRTKPIIYGHFLNEDSLQNDRYFGFCIVGKIEFYKNFYRNHKN